MFSGRRSVAPPTRVANREEENVWLSVSVRQFPDDEPDKIGPETYQDDYSPFSGFGRLLWCRLSGQVKRSAGQTTAILTTLIAAVAAVFAGIIHGD